MFADSCHIIPISDYFLLLFCLFSDFGPKQRHTLFRFLFQMFVEKTIKEYLPEYCTVGQDYCRSENRGQTLSPAPLWLTFI